jgi:YggT family protein
LNIIGALIDLYSLVLVATVILSWFPVDPRSPVATTLRALTEPALAPIRRALPPIGGLDLSPLVLFAALRMLGRVL